MIVEMFPNDDVVVRDAEMLMMSIFAEISSFRELLQELQNSNIWESWK